MENKTETLENEKNAQMTAQTSQGIGPEMQSYFDNIDEGLKKEYAIATAARAKGFDPERKVEIPLAKDMAERVEGLISAAAPQLLGAGVTARIRELEQQYGALDWRVALAIAFEVAQEKFCKFKDKKEAMEVGIRTGFAYHTVGIVSAPLEGFVELLIKKRRDGKEYFAPKFAGPIRGAGGTAASVCLIITDYVRLKMGYEKYDPGEKEKNRFVTELDDYHERVTNLQYHGSEEEIYFLASNLPVEIDGHATEDIEVSNYKDNDRIDTNQIRGGVCLVMSMVALKAPKLWKEISKWGKDFDLDWGFLEQFIALQKKKKSGAKTSDGIKAKIMPDFTYLFDLVAGRPVLAYPLRTGGFRLRYGRTRFSGYSAASIHPATMRLLNDYIATGTQLKMERPGKAAAITPCDSIDGPIVLLDDGTVMKISDEKKAKELAGRVKKIVFLGDILISYGDFFDRAHTLVPPGYCQEWWVREFEKGIVSTFGSFETEKVSQLTGIDSARINQILKEPVGTKVGFEEALKLSVSFSIPMHPDNIFYFKSLGKSQFLQLLSWLEKAKLSETGNDGKVNKIILPLKNGNKTLLENIGLPHYIATEYVIVEGDEAKAISLFFGINNPDTLADDIDKIKKICEETPEEEFAVTKIIKIISGITVRDKSGVFIGSRMGRPEKAKMRKLTGSPQVLFPVGTEGGRLRCFQSALEAGRITADFPMYRCANPECNNETIYSVCEKCGSESKKMVICKACGLVEDSKCSHEHTRERSRFEYSNRAINIKHYFDSALARTGSKNYPDLIKGVRGTSNKDHSPEHLVKGILRAKNDIYVNKDGTTRYDMTELPITYFKPKEIRTSVDRLRELGYTKDAYGKELRSDNQVVELKCQDVILPGNFNSGDEPANEVLFRVCNFIDDLLVCLYGLEPYYNLKSRDDVTGQLVVGLAPHISAGIVGRVIGFSDTQSLLAHPLFHAAMRRDADGDEACIILMMDALLNFSRKFLPDRIGGRTMDAPLVLTSVLNPAEVDDMVHKMDTVWSYPLDFYEACAEYKKPWEVKIALYGKRLGTVAQYQDLGFTHNSDNVNSGVNCSAYKTLPSMEEKLRGQMEIAQKIAAVDESDVARLVIEKHFIKDIKGNLRKFSTQEYRCVNCNEKYRRPPMIGKCIKCSGKIIFTISRGSVVKYLEPSMSLAEKYNVPAYLKQSLDLTRRRIEGVFGKEKEIQAGLGRWFG